MKKNIFGIFREYIEPKKRLLAETQEKIMSYLKEDYDMTISYNLSETARPLLERAIQEGKRFDAILTHIPPATIPASPQLNDREKHMLAYTKTLEFLKELRTKASSPLKKQIPLVAYTAAKPEYEALFRAKGIDAIIYKFHINNWENEAKKIKETLDFLIVQ